MREGIVKKLIDLGFDEEYKGFQYLVYLLVRVCEAYRTQENGLLDMRVIYQEAADWFGIQYRTVEHSVRSIIRWAAWWGKNRTERPSRKVLRYCAPDSYATRPFVLNLAADLLDQWTAERAETGER